MPRRSRKKSTQQRKPPLVFTESPVNIHHNLPSPVLGAIHPPTADVVSVEDCLNLPWVSPQFNPVPGTCRGRKRLARRHRSQHPPHQTGNISLINKENSRAKFTKYKPLRFEGDEDSSTILDVSGSESESVDLNGHGPRRRVINLKSNASKVRTSLRNRLLDLSSSPVVQAYRYYDSGELNVGAGEGQNGDSGAIGSHGSDGNHGDQEHGVISQKGTSSDDHDDLESCENELNFPLKRLFTLQNNKYTSTNEELEILSSQPFNPQDSVLDSDVSDIDSEPRFVRRSKRLKQRYLETFGSSQTPDRHINAVREVLVTDTPESEYGLPVRIRKRKLTNCRARLGVL